MGAHVCHSMTFSGCVPSEGFRESDALFQLGNGMSNAVFSLASKVHVVGILPQKLHRGLIIRHPEVSNRPTGHPVPAIIGIWARGKGILPGKGFPGLVVAVCDAVDRAQLADDEGVLRCGGLAGVGEGEGFLEVGGGDGVAAGEAVDPADFAEDAEFERGEGGECLAHVEGGGEALQGEFECSLVEVFAALEGFLFPIPFEVGICISGGVVAVGHCVGGW